MRETVNRKEHKERIEIGVHRMKLQSVWAGSCPPFPRNFWERGVSPASREPKTETRRRDAGAPRNCAPVHDPDARPMLEVEATHVCFAVECLEALERALALWLAQNFKTTAPIGSSMT